MASYCEVAVSQIPLEIPCCVCGNARIASAERPRNLLQGERLPYETLTTLKFALRNVPVRHYILPALGRASWNAQSEMKGEVLRSEVALLCINFPH